MPTRRAAWSALHPLMRKCAASGISVSSGNSSARRSGRTPGRCSSAWAASQRRLPEVVGCRTLEAMATHPFDRAIGLTAAAGQPNTWHGHSSPDYWNMVGPFGGTTAATALQAVMQHPALLGEPIALTVNYAAAMGEGPFTVVAEPARTNRSTQ